MSRHNFNFDGGEYLTKMGASWFISYSYWLYIDKTKTNWEKVLTYSSRISVFNRSKKHHNFWLKQILLMNDKNLNKNSIELNAIEVKEMAKTILVYLTNDELNTN